MILSSVFLFVLAALPFGAVGGRAVVCQRYKTAFMLYLPGWERPRMLDLQEALKKECFSYEVMTGSMKYGESTEFPTLLGKIKRNEEKYIRCLEKKTEEVGQLGGGEVNCRKVYPQSYVTDPIPPAFPDGVQGCEEILVGLHKGSF